MDYFLPYHVFEKTLQKSAQELKSFQSDSNIQIDLDQLLQSVEAMRVSLSDIFSSISSLKDLNRIHDNTLFLAQVRQKKMRCGEVMDSGDNATFMDTPFRCVMIYGTELTELDTPTYMVIQRQVSEKWLSPELYYVQEDISNFFRKLTTLNLTVVGDDEMWEYVTSNSGEDWLLQQGRETELLLTNLDWKSLDKIKKSGSYRLIFQ